MKPEILCDHITKRRLYSIIITLSVTVAQTPEMSSMSCNLLLSNNGISETSMTICDNAEQREITDLLSQVYGILSQSIALH